MLTVTCKYYNVYGNVVGLTIKAENKMKFDIIDWIVVTVGLNMLVTKWGKLVPVVGIEDWLTY